MPCPPLVPISIIPPVSQGPSPILWQNGNQITRLNTPLNQSFLVYDGTTTRWGDGSAQAPILLPNIQEVNNATVAYVAGVTTTGQIVKTLGASGTAIIGGQAGEVIYQSAPSVTSFTAVGTSGQVLSSNGSSAPTWLNQSSLSVGNATNATNATTSASCSGNSATATLATTATNIANGGAGQIPYNTASGATSFLAAGIAGQFLQSNGTSAPSWASSGISWTAASTTTTATENSYIATSTASSAWTLTLPTSPATRSTVWVIDSANNWSTNNLTIAPGGANTIQGSVQNLICNVSNRLVILYYTGSTWQINV